MAEFEVDLVDGSTETLRLLEHVPTRVGIKTRKKFDVKAHGTGSTVEYDVENPQERFEDAKMYLVEELFDRSGCGVDIDSLSYESFNKIARHYWSQVRGERAKNSEHASDTTSE